MTIRRESAVPAGAPFVGVNELLYNEADGGLYVKLPDGAVRRVNVPPSDARVSSGNARGADAVDFQYTRDRLDQVASGAKSVLIGGRNNLAAGIDSMVLAGDGNDVTGEHSVAGGEQVLCVGNESFHFGHMQGGGGDRSTMFGEWNIDGSGVKEVISYDKATRVLTWNAAHEVGAAVTDAGFMNKGVMLFSSDVSQARRVMLDSVDVASQTMTFAAAGEYTDFEDGLEESPDLFAIYMLDGPEDRNVFFGSGNRSLGAVSSFFMSEKADGNPGIIRGYAYGYKPNLSINGERAHADGVHTVPGSAQYSFFVLRKQTSNATPYFIGVNSGTRLVLEDNRMVAFRGMIAARSQTGDKNAIWFFHGAIKRSVGVGTVVLVGVPVLETFHKDAGAATWGIDIKADATNGALEIEVTGEASTIIYWTGQVDWVKTAQI